jgi:hypothetical protein
MWSAVALRATSGLAFRPVRFPQALCQMFTGKHFASIIHTTSATLRAACRAGDCCPSATHIPEHVPDRTVIGCFTKIAGRCCVATGAWQGAGAPPPNGAQAMMNAVLCIRAPGSLVVISLLWLFRQFVALRPRAGNRHPSKACGRCSGHPFASVASSWPPSPALRHERRHSGERTAGPETLTHFIVRLRGAGSSSPGRRDSPL